MLQPSKWHRLTLSGAAGLLIGWSLLVGALLSGCGEDEFEFIITDDRGKALEDVEILYHREAGPQHEEVVIGRTNAEGRLTVSGVHLDIDHVYQFRKECIVSDPLERFDPHRCAVVSGTGPGQYSFHARDGRLLRSDLKKGHRVVKMTCAPRAIDLAGGTEDPRDYGRQQSQKRVLELTSEPGALVRINGRMLGTVPQTGLLRTDFCPGDSAECFSATLTIAVEKQGFETFVETRPLPEPLGVIQLSARLSVHLAPPPSTPDQPAEPAARDVRVRIENRGLPQSCGSGLEWPDLLVNNLRTRVPSSPASTGLRAYYDLLLTPNAEYCIAMECPEGGQSPESWNPWDPGAGQPEWYRIRIPADVQRVYYAVPSYRPGGPLVLLPESSGSWDRFDVQHATRITEACTRD